MALDRTALQQRLLESFHIEARERLGTLADGLAGWHDTDTHPANLDALFREVHSLKGAAQAVGLEQFEQICHAWESLFAAVRSGAIALSAPAVSACRRAVNMLERLQGGTPLDGEAVRELLAALESGARGQPIVLSETDASTAIPTPASGLVKVSADDLAQLLHHSETLLQHKLAANAIAQSMRALTANLEPQLGRRALRGIATKPLRELSDTLPPARRDELKALLDYVDWSAAQFDRVHSQAADAGKRLAKLTWSMSQLVDGYARDMSSLLLLPANNLIEGLPAMVQDLADKAGKRVHLEIKTANLQIDKRILDGLRTPLNHLLRNALDHGIDPPHERSLFGKPASGILSIELAQQSADRFRLLVRDDGRGINIAQLKARALQAGLIDEDAALQLADDDALKLVFLPGLSTSPAVNEISGRGLGMSIVQEAIEEMGGRLEIRSKSGQGTAFEISLPLSLSTFRAVIVRNAERLFAVPALAVERCLRVAPESLKTLENRPSLAWGGKVLPVWPLADVLGLERIEPPPGDLTLLLLDVRNDRFLLLVDELLGDQEINVKTLGKQLRRVRNVMGATLLGDGQLVPILHPGDLHASALATTGSSMSQREESHADTRPLRLLIAEDSFTSRGLLKAILEDAGYQVATATDGLDAWNALKHENFDLLISDVEMPRMDGLTLTARLRSDPALAGLPVILVTALESAEDRARGLDVGANAYLVKSSFGQDNLLDTIRRLI